MHSCWSAPFVHAPTQQSYMTMRCTSLKGVVVLRHQLGSIKTAMGERFHSYKRNQLVRSKVKTHKQRMQYEAIVQVAQIQDEDLLYLNFSNAAIGLLFSIFSTTPMFTLVASLPAVCTAVHAVCKYWLVPHSACSS